MDHAYSQFLAGKSPRAQATGVDPAAMPDHLFDFQAHVAEFAVRQGRAGVYLDTGLGKSRIQMEWAHQAMRAGNGKALILTPLAVARQMEREAQSLGYDARVIRDQYEAKAGINICNYDRLDKLDVDEFGAVSLDESSILKSLSGKTSQQIISMFAGHRFRLSATATPAPNDHMELGQQSAFLGIMPANEMLMRWFINDTKEASQQWRLKGHAEQDFWDWMASWSRMAQSPEDMGFDGSRYVLPPLEVIKHKLSSGPVMVDDGGLFGPIVNASNMFALKKQTAEERAQLIGNLTNDGKVWTVWCDTDAESAALMKAMPDAVEVKGSMAIERKEENLDAFATGKARVIVTKPSITGWGCNWQHCHNIAFVGRSFSYEAWYQAVRRSWRFGQKNAVKVHIAVADGEDQIGRVIDRKAADHANMKSAMVAAMKRAVNRDAATKVPYNPTYIGRMPSWLKSVA